MPRTAPSLCCCVHPLVPICRWVLAAQRSRCSYQQCSADKGGSLSLMASLGRGVQAVTHECSQSARNRGCLGRVAHWGVSRTCVADRSTRMKNNAETAWTFAASRCACMNGANDHITAAEMSCSGTSHDFLRPKDLE